MSDEKWNRVHRAAREMEERLSIAKTEEQYQLIGGLGREVLISIAQAVYNRQLHGIAADGAEPGETDAKRMLDLYIDSVLPGGANEEMRRFAKSTVALAPAVLHRRTATMRDASLCMAATQCMIRVIVVLSEQVGSQPVPKPIGPSAEELPDAIYRAADLSRAPRFPQVPLNPAQECWLEILANTFETGQRQPDQVLFRIHKDRLGPKFKPSSVDRPLAVEGGRHITPVGLWRLNPDTPWLQRVDLLFRYIKQLIEARPELNDLRVNVLATKLELTDRQVSHCMHLLRTCHGWAFAGGGGNQDPQHYLLQYSTFNFGKEQVFRFYETFINLEEVIRGTLLAADPPSEL